jgi:DNA-binding transcriptional regulator YhcF (GntR family)
MKMNSTLEINSFSKIPKYKQVVDNIIADIHLGKFKIGQKIPSINETSFEYLLSRDTVEKAYNELRSKGVIVSVRGKGYYINDTQTIGKKRVLLLLNKVSSYKKKIYSLFLEKLNGKAIVDLKIHNGDISLLEEFLEEDTGCFHHIIIIPQFNATDQEIQKVLSTVPKEKLILLDYEVKNFDKYYASIYQNFEKDIYQALKCANSDLRKYDSLQLIFPDSSVSNHSQNIISGFRNFCFHHKYDFKVEEQLKPAEVEKGKAFLLISEEDLIAIIKICREKSLEIGKDVGVLSYNDNPVKEVLCGGINVVSTDFDMMSDKMAKIVLENKAGRSANDFVYIKRSSL